MKFAINGRVSPISDKYRLTGKSEDGRYCSFAITPSNEPGKEFYYKAYRVAYDKILALGAFLVLGAVSTGTYGGDVPPVDRAQLIQNAWEENMTLAFERKL